MSILSLLTLGYITATDALLSLLRFVYSYILPSPLPRYKHGPIPAWALVTGATSGLGLALCSELCAQEFNLLLHGRSREKLEAVQRKLLAQYPKQNVEILILDASSCFSTAQYEESRTKILSAVQERGLTLLINNCGVGHDLQHDFRALTDETPRSIDRVLDTNIRFTTHLTHLILPTLTKTAPSLIINIGSLASLAMPYVSVYSATKAYLETFTKALDNEMRAEKLEVKVECMLFGDIDTPVHRKDKSVLVVTAEQAAKSVVHRAGSMGPWGTEPVGSAYWFHSFLYWACIVQPWCDR